MIQSLIPASLKGYRIHLVGIKGTGMAALAEILLAGGASISGSDVPETFYTDQILKKLGIPFQENFSAAHIKPAIKLVIHSAAYSRLKNTELIAAHSAGIPVISYPEALGLLSEHYDANGIAGTHGKTTTTAMTGTILKHLQLPAVVLAGSEVKNFGSRSSLVLGHKYFVAETCEYRRHFLNFKPQRIIITGIEAEHLDYFRDLEDVLEAFESFALLLPRGGTVIFNNDDPGSSRLISLLPAQRSDLDIVPYGSSAAGRFGIHSVDTNKGNTFFKLQGFPVKFNLKIPGLHSAYNAAAAIALTCRILEKEKGSVGVEDLDGIREALQGFQGCRRRSEVLGEAKAVLFMDDYGHHPTEIRKTLEGLRSFYPDKRLVVDFMPHTYSRTACLLTQFGSSFRPADEVILHQIYASAREGACAEITGRTLFLEVQKNRPSVRYFEQPAQAIPYLEQTLKAGDLFVTMGAGDNWKLGKMLFERFSEKKP